MDRQNKVENWISPEYKRMQFKKHFFCSLDKFRNTEKSDVSKFSYFYRAMKSLVFCSIDPVGHAHYDYIISGSDLLLSLCQCRSAQLNNKRVLIYPYNTDDQHEISKTLIEHNQLMFDRSICNIICNELKCDNIGDTTNTLKEITLSLLKSIYDDNQNEEAGTVHIANEDLYSFDSHWTSMFEGKPTARLVNGQLNDFPRSFLLALKSIPRFSQNMHNPVTSLKGSIDQCILTYDKLILNTRPSGTMNIEGLYDYLIKFSDADIPVEKRKNITVSRRFREIQQSIGQIK